MYQPGDELVLRIEEDFGYRDKTFREAKVQVIGEGDTCLCYVPHYLNVPHSFRINSAHQTWFNFHKKFIGEMGIFISEDTKVIRVIRVIKATPGAPCDRCEEFIPDAVKHIDQKLHCRACRENPYR